MKRFWFAFLSTVVLAAVLLASVHSLRRTPDIQDSTGAVTLPNGWRITPAGRSIALPGDLPMKMTRVDDGARVLVLTAGFHDHTLNVIDPRAAKLTASLDVLKAWDGMAFDAKSGMVYLSGGGPAKQEFTSFLAEYAPGSQMKESLDKAILRVKYSNGKLTPVPGIRLEGLDEKQRFISGVALGPDGALYALNLQTDALYRLRGPDFGQQTAVKTGRYPYGIVFAPDGKTLAVSNWGDESVCLLDAASLQEKARVKVGSHPNEMVWAKDGRLFVANSGSNTVSVIKGSAVAETIRTSMDARALVGSTPDALALSPDEKTLYIANADNNNLAVIDVEQKGQSRVAGFVPTGWYPTAIGVAPNGRQIYVGTGKGMGFRKNYPAQRERARSVPNEKTPYDYIGFLLSGHVSVVDVPDAAKLAAYTKQAIANVPVPESYVDAKEAAVIRNDVLPKIKHVLYIIRENRTYDQVFGDLGAGNGDPKLAIFGEQTTPNAHALARKLVTLDNLYCDGEVSEDGHQWSNAAYATDFTEKAWTNSYSRRGEPDADDLKISPAGYLWDACARHHLTFRTYGEMASFVSSQDSAPQVKAVGSLAGHVSLDWLKEEGGRDTDRAAIFIRELKEAERSGDWPNFMVMSLGEDHTSGLKPKAFTPTAAVASNDEALGQIVQAVSHSRFWKETAIFAIEDDAQNGPDHVDAHRTVGLVISPWVKRGVVDSTMYTTSSFVRTMELILGLPPMTQYDTAATPLYASFTTKPVFDGIDLQPEQVDLTARNPETGPGAVASMKLDFSAYDRADPDELNRILWAALRPGEPMPAPVRSARLRR